MLVVMDGLLVMLVVMDGLLVMLVVKQYLNLLSMNGQHQQHQHQHQHVVCGLYLCILLEALYIKNKTTYMHNC